MKDLRQQPYRQIFKKTGLMLWVIILFLNHCLGQNQAEEDLWDEIIAPKDYAYMIEKCEDYIAVYCQGSNQTRERCRLARQRMENAQGILLDRALDRCLANTDPGDRIDCYEDQLRMYQSHPGISTKIQALLDEEENRIWDSVNHAPALWTTEFYNQYLELFPQGHYRDLANSRLEFLEQSGAMEPSEFYREYVTGKGVDRLQYFQLKFPESQQASAASVERDNIEEAFWQSAEIMGTLEGYEKYVANYPNGQYAGKAEQQIVILRNMPGIARTEDEQRWFQIRSSKDPEVIRNFIQNYSESPLVDEANKRIIALDLEYWQEIKNVNSALAVENYLNIFPDGAFIRDARLLIPTLANTEEDKAWSILQNEPSEHSIKDFLIKFPNSKYRNLAARLMTITSPIRYTVRQEGPKHYIQFFNAHNLRVTKYPEGLILDETRLQAENLLGIVVQYDAFYTIELVDENGKEIIVDWNRDIRILNYQENSDSIKVLIAGGLIPYFLDLEDTVNELRHFQFPSSFQQENIEVAKSELQELMGPGIYTVSILDKSRKNIKTAGIINLQTSLESILKWTVVGLIGAIFSMGLWTFLNKIINKRKTVFDEMDFEE